MNPNKIAIEILERVTLELALLGTEASNGGGDGVLKGTIDDAARKGIKK